MLLEKLHGWRDLEEGWSSSKQHKILTVRAFLIMVYILITDFSTEEHIIARS